MNALAPLPHHPRPAVMHMRWQDLAFLHWPVDHAALEAHIPRGLTLETFGGHAWIGVVPFAMRGVRASGLPEIPGTNEFLELNVRTYVTDGSRPGVWFFSLDCENALAVRGARFAFHLPYLDARMWSARRHGTLEYESTRTHAHAPGATFRARYAPDGPVFRAEPGSLEHWLTERYCLYSASRSGRVYRGEIAHEPWPLQPAKLELLECDMTRLVGLELQGAAPLAHFVERVDVRAWMIERVL